MMKQCMIRSTIPTRGWKSALFGAVAFTTPSVFAQVPMAGVEVVNAWREAGRQHPTMTVANAAAPRWISEHSLGRPLDENFEPIPGPDGAPLFDLAHRVSQRSHNETTHEQTVLDTLTGLRANASFLGVGSAQISTLSDRRFALFSAAQLERVSELDDQEPVRMPPPRAVWYVSHIYYGRAFYAVVQGSSSRFDAGVRSQFSRAPARVNIQSWAEDFGLVANMRSLGLRAANGSALFSASPDEVRQNYTADSETQPNPIFVTYRSIPGRTPHDQQINFTQLGRGRYQIRFERLVIDREGPRNPSLRLYASCRVSDREVGRSATPVFDGPASSAHNNGHELRWATTVSLEPDQEVTCGFSGQWSGSLYGGDVAFGGFSWAPSSGRRGSQEHTLTSGPNDVWRATVRISRVD
jgi:hypothetical protein